MIEDTDPAEATTSSLHDLTGPIVTCLEIPAENLSTESLVSTNNIHGGLDTSDSIMTGTDMPLSDDFMAELEQGSTVPADLMDHTLEFESQTACSSTPPIKAHVARPCTLESVETFFNVDFLIEGEREQDEREGIQQKSPVLEQSCSSDGQSTSQMGGLVDVAYVSEGMVG